MSWYRLVCASAVRQAGAFKDAVEKHMNNTFRSTYRELSESEKARISEIKRMAEELNEHLHADGDNREGLQRGLALARTKLEECVMWATKAVTG